jgi:hypothetical protein
MSASIIKYNEHDKPIIKIIDGIKMYMGTTQQTKEKYDYSIKMFKHSIETNIFTKLTPSTITVKGKFTNIKFNESDVIKTINEPTGYILEIGCNYGVRINKNPLYLKPKKKNKTSNRGRKPKKKPISKRKLQGSGKYFSSQMTFDIYNPNNGKIYKIKLFRNGGFQAPGVKKPDMSDLLAPIKILRDYLRVNFGNDNINVTHFISVMRNYTCHIKNPQFLIKLKDLEVLLKNNKKRVIKNTLSNIIIELTNTLPTIKDICRQYIESTENDINLAEISHNCERYLGLILKFYRPIPWKADKRTTIKVLRSGKINIDGGNSVEECFELYYWLEKLFNDNKKNILFDMDAEISNSDEYSTDGMVPIYDDDSDYIDTDLIQK